MKKKITALLLTTALAMTAVTGCGSAGGSAQAKTPADEGKIVVHVATAQNSVPVSYHDDDDNRDAKRPVALKVTLNADGEPAKDADDEPITAELTAANGWSAYWDVPVYAGGKKIVYTDAILYFYLIREGSISRVAVKNTDMISAFENRIEYFQANGLDQFLPNTYQTYLTVLMRTYTHLIETPESPRIKKEIVEKAKVIYKTHKDILKDNSKLKHEVMLFTSFPALYKKS